MTGAIVSFEENCIQDREREEKNTHREKERRRGYEVQRHERSLTTL